MGIFLDLAVSKSITRTEWSKFYEESLQLAKKLNLAERRIIKIHGINVTCLVPTEEREEICGWNNEYKRTGWFAEGDYTYLHTAEDYYMPKNLVADDAEEEDIWDAMMGALPAYTHFDWNDERCQHAFSLWGNKTQGEPYHILLLGIACLAEARLGKKAFIYGDITRGQCKRAVEIVNYCLDVPIEMPDRCYMDRFAERVKNLPLSELEKVEIYHSLYLGTQDAEFGSYMRGTFSEDSLREFWKGQFAGGEIGSYEFRTCFQEYMLLGFDLEQLCKIVRFESKDGLPLYKKFVRTVMDAKMHLMAKNTEDLLRIDQEEEHPYTVWTLLNQFVFRGAGNLKVDRYIPLEDIRTALINAIGDKCDVYEIIDEYVAEENAQIRKDVNDMSSEEFSAAIEQDASDVFHQIVDKKRQKAARKLQEYDITTYSRLIFYRSGNTLPPEYMESIGKSRQFLDAALKEERYRELLQETPLKKFEWLVNQNTNYLIRDIDWEQIFSNIEKDTDSFARYYPLMRVKLDSKDLVYMATAMMINDDFYSYSAELRDQYGQRDDESRFHG